MNAIRLTTFALALAALIYYGASTYSFYPAKPLHIALVILLPYLFLLVSHSPREIGSAFLDAFRKEGEGMSRERLGAGASAMSALGHLSLALGVLGALWSFFEAFNHAAEMGETVKPRAMLPFLSEAGFLLILGAALRWFLYGPMQAMLEGAKDSSEECGG
jgi:hypothetical protein